MNFGVIVSLVRDLLIVYRTYFKISALVYAKNIVKGVLTHAH